MKPTSFDYRYPEQDLLVRAWDSNGNIHEGYVEYDSVLDTFILEREDGHWIEVLKLEKWIYCE